MLLTQKRYYDRQQDKYKDSVILMKVGMEYYIIGSNADKYHPIVDELLTHKDAGKMYVYDNENYGYTSLSFGKHNLEKVLFAIVHNSDRVMICDFDKAFKESGGWEEVDRINADYRRKQEEYERLHRQPIQLTFDF